MPHPEGRLVRLAGGESHAPAVQAPVLDPNSALARHEGDALALRAREGMFGLDRVTPDGRPGAHEPPHPADSSRPAWIGGMEGDRLVIHREFPELGPALPGAEANRPGVDEVGVVVVFEEEPALNADLERRAREFDRQVGA